MWVCGNSDGTGLGDSGLIGVVSFNQHGHQLDGTIMVTRGYKSKTFKQSGWACGKFDGTGLDDFR
jgi:hypothetical protein